MMNLHWAAQYIGRAYHKEDFHCWEMCRVVQLEQFSIECAFVDNPDTAFGQAHLIENHPERKRWDEVQDKEEGDLVQLRRNEDPRHVGVLIHADDVWMVLHCVRGNGVVAQSFSDLSVHGWKIEGFYRFIG